MIQRGGQVVIQMLDNVQQQTVEPLLKATITSGSLLYTDEYGIYNALTDWGYGHKTHIPQVLTWSYCIFDA